MIVIGLDVHKQSVTAVAVDEAGRPLSEKVIPVGSDELLDWAGALDAARLWAVEDCRQLTRWLERQLLAVGEDVVRVPPKLTVAGPKDETVAPVAPTCSVQVLVPMRVQFRSSVRALPSESKIWIELVDRVAGRAPVVGSTALEGRLAA